MAPDTGPEPRLSAALRTRFQGSEGVPAPENPYLGELFASLKGVSSRGENGRFVQ
jgi:hypothetical protein